MHWTGKFPPEYQLIKHWEKDDYQRKYVWNQAVMSALLSNELSMDDLKPYQRNYKQTRVYNNYVRTNKGYLQEVKDWIEAIEQNEKGIKRRHIKHLDEEDSFDPEQVLKQIKFYEENKEKGYAPSKDVERFMDFKDEAKIVDVLKQEFLVQQEERRERLAHAEDDIITTMSKLPKEIVKEKYDVRMIEKRTQMFKKEKLRA